MAFDLRPYQVAAVDKVRHAMCEGKLRVLLYSPTGSGKTEVAMEIVRGALNKGKRVAFIANRIELISGASRRFGTAGIAHGVLQGANTVNLHSPVLIASIQTVASRGLPPVDLIIVDEAHGCAGSKAYQDLLLKKHNLVPVIGLSATPFSPGLGKIFEELVSAATIRELIDLDYLVDCEIYSPSEPDLTGVKIVSGDYQPTQLGKAVDKQELVGGIVKHWLKLADRKPTVCFATNIAHSLHIVEQFRAAGASAEHIDCHTKPEERAATLARVASGETTIISNVAVLAEGWDCPAVEVMILARPTRSLIRYIQMAGRVLRPASGKTRALLLDHSGTALQLGFPTDDLPLVLDNGKGDTSGKRQREEPKAEECAKCSFIRPPKVHACPKYGFAPERQNDVEVVEGELVKQVRASKRPLTKSHKQHAYSQLISIANARGYQDGWVSNKYREFFGMWPRSLNKVSAAPSEEILDWVKSRQIAHAKRPGARHAAD